MVEQKVIRHASATWEAHLGAQTSQTRAEVRCCHLPGDSPQSDGVGQELMSAKLAGPDALNDGITGQSKP